MFKTHEEKSKGDKNDDDLPKPQSTKMAEKEKNKNQNTNEGERSLEDIEKELNELRPKPPSPKTQHRIEGEEKKKDQQIEESKGHKESSVPSKTTSDNEENNQQRKENELTPGQPDPTVNCNVKIPVLNDRGDVELKPQLGSALNKNKKDSSNDEQSTEENKKEKE